MMRLRALAYAVPDTVGYIVGAYGYGETAPVPDRGKFATDIDQSNRSQ